jgi:hypothetical protein
MSSYLVSCADVRSLSDGAAEREAEALAWFAENLDQHEPVTPLARERDMRLAAIERGIDPPPHPRYPRGAAVRRWLKVVDALAAGTSPRLRDAGTWPTTRAERARRSAQYRLERAKCLRALPAGESEVSIARAAELLGLSRSGAEKAAYGGRLPCRKVGRRTVVPVDALFAFSRSRLAVAA